MDFPKYNYPVSWRRTTDIPKLSDDYGSYGAISFTKNDSEDEEHSKFEFNFKRLSGKQHKCNYIATSTTLPLLHPDEDPGIPDVSIKDLFQTTSASKSQPMNRAPQQAAYLFEKHSDVVFETSHNLLHGCFRTLNKNRKKMVYKRKYKESVIPVLFGSRVKDKRMYELLGDVLSDIQPDLIQTLLHEEIETLAKKIVNNPIYRGGCVSYQHINRTIGIILSACGPPMDVLKIQPVCIRTSSSSTQQADSPDIPSTSANTTTSSTSPTTSQNDCGTSPISTHSAPVSPRTCSTANVPPDIPQVSDIPQDTPVSSDEAIRPTISKHGDVDYTLGTEKEPHLIAFQGVIRQITSIMPSTQEIVYIGIRTDYHCHVLTTEHVDDKLKLQILHTVEFQYQPTFIALSPFIPGECVITLENGGVDLITTNKGVVTQIPPMFEGFAGSVWRQCHFGSHPRLLVSTEHKKVDLIDVKDTTNLKETNLFQLPSKHLTQLEDILVARQHPSNYFLHFVASHHQLLMFDERFPHIPLLEWNHLLTTPPNYIDIFAPVNAHHVVVIASYTSCEAHCFQFELIKSKPPGVIGPGWKVATVSGWFSLLPDLPATSHVYDAAKQRLLKPFIGVSIIAHQSNTHPGFTVIMTNSLGDLFSQTYISTNQRPALDKTLNVGPGCPDIELNEAERKRCYDWLDALTLDYEQKPLDDGCLLDVKKVDALDLYKEISEEANPDHGCPFCCKEPITTKYGHMTPSKCPACGLNPDISFNLIEKYYTGPCVITRKSLGLSDEEGVDDIIADDLHVKPGGPNTDDVGRTLWNMWKGPSTDKERNNGSARKATRRTSTVSRPQEALVAMGPSTASLANQDAIDTRPSQQDQDETQLSQQSVNLFSQSNSQSQSLRKSGRKRRRPEKLRGMMGF